MDQRNTDISTRCPTASTEVCERDITEVPDVPATTTTPPVILDVEPRGTSSPELAYLKGLHPNPLLL